MADSDPWDPDVGDKKRVSIAPSEDGIKITSPPYVGTIRVDGELDYPVDRIESVTVEITEETGLMEVTAVPVGNYELVDSASPDQHPNKWELVEELRRLAADLGRTPTMTHVDEYSEYTADDYREMFDSFIDAITIAGLEPTTDQYNFSDREKPEGRKATKNVRYLKEHGPAFADELPAGVGTNDKRHGLTKFSMSIGQRKSTKVYYLMDNHSKDKVISKFVDEKQDELEDISQRTLTSAANNNGSGWGKVLKRHLYKH